MGSSASSPPGDDQAPNGEDEELELTSIMDAEQRRALQKAARAQAEAKQPPPEPEEQQRPTARPPPEAEAAAQSERDVSIPKPQPVPAEASEAAAHDEPARKAPAAAAKPTAPARSLDLLTLLAFGLLVAAVAYEFSR